MGIILTVGEKTSTYTTTRVGFVEFLIGYKYTHWLLYNIYLCIVVTCSFILRIRDRDLYIPIIVCDAIVYKKKNPIDCGLYRRSSRSQYRKDARDATSL